MAMDGDIKFRDPAVEEFNTSTLLKQAARQAAKRKYEDFLIVDVDAHHYETESFAEITEYIEDPVLRGIAQAKKGTGAGRPGMSAVVITMSCFLICSATSAACLA